MKGNSRYVINDLVKKPYNIRSGFVHSNRDNTEVDMYNKILLVGHNIIIETLSEFLKLEDKSITT